MPQENNSAMQPIHLASLAKRMLLGAVIALVVISVFLLGAGDANPAWPKLWMLRPLIIVPIAGAMGGAFYYFMDRMSYQGGWRKIVAIIFSVVGYLFALWVGTILGLDGTWWD